jgi:hypothetical protein
MAGTREITEVFRIVNRRVMRRGSFRFGVFIAYGLVLIVLRFAANAYLAMSVLRAHPDYDAADFYRQSMLMLTFFGTALVPLMTVRATSEILGHPRLAHIPTSRKAQAQLLFSASRAPFIGVAALLTLHLVLASRTAGFGADIAVLYLSALIVCVAGNYAVTRIFGALRLRTQTAETLLLALVALCVFLNPQTMFEGKRVALSFPAAARGLGLGWICLTQLAFVAIEALALVVLRAAALAGAAVQRRLVRRAFAKMVLHRAPLTFLLGCSLAEAYILALPLNPTIKALLVCFLIAFAAGRCGDAIFQTNAEAFALFRRKVPPLQYLEPVALYILFLAAPLLLRARV